MDKSELCQILNKLESYYNVATTANYVGVKDTNGNIHVFTYVNRAWKETQVFTVKPVEHDSPSIIGHIPHSEWLLVGQANQLLIFRKSADTGWHQIRTMTYFDPICSIAISRDECYVVVATQTHSYVFKIQQWQLISQLKPKLRKGRHYHTATLALSDNAEIIAIGHTTESPSKGQVDIYQRSDTQWEYLSSLRVEAEQLYCSPSGSVIASGTLDHVYVFQDTGLGWLMLYCLSGQDAMSTVVGLIEDDGYHG